MKINRAFALFRLTVGTDRLFFFFKEDNKELWRTRRGQTATEVRFQSAIKIAE